MEEMPTAEKRPILVRFGEMNPEQLIAFYKENKNLVMQVQGKKMEEEHRAGGISPETFRTALRRVVTNVPGPGESEELLKKIKENN
ncbi:MAG: hypothetical protein KGH93_02390 [Patescibacteria group bacterium]|nr:hypothetical protein [Patescibacteria group bacterium]MDE1946026.1 hypothetical protein [Patescibacteria group bacterium]